MRSRVFLYVLLITAGSLALPIAAHASIPYFGPIVPDAINRCAAGWGAVIIVINNVIELAITLGIVLLLPIRIAMAGFQIVTSQGNPGAITKARQMVLNTILGIVIAMAAWLIVDAVMAVIYNPNASSGTTTLGTWSSIINFNSPSGPCLIQEGALQNLNQSSVGATGVSATGQTLSSSINNTPGNACNPQTIVAAAPNVSIQNANLLACIAQGESTCGTKNPPYNNNFSWNIATANGKASTAAGAYQVLLSSNSSCYNNSVCEQAGGTPGVALNCAAGFGANGFTAGGNATVLANCEKAAGNVSCSAAAAACLLGQQSFAAAYATDKYEPTCLSTYGN